MTRKEIHNLVKAKVISVDEAREVRQKSFQDLRELLKDISKDIRDVKIQDQIEKLKEEVKKANAENLNANNLETCIKAILEPFEQIDHDVRSNLLIARLKIKRIAAAESIIKDPEKGRAFDLPVGSEGYERLAREFQALFPVFLGYRVEALKGYYRGFDISLIGGPPGAVSPTKALKPILEEFLAWELRKVGYTMEYYVEEGRRDEKYFLRCNIDWVEPGSALSTIIKYMQEPTKPSAIDTKALKEFLMTEFETKVDKMLAGYAITEFYPPAGQITTTRVGPWLWVKSRMVYGGLRWDPSTDRVLGDREKNEAERDWVGPAASAPAKVSRPKELDKWAYVKTSFESHNLRQEGRCVAEVTKDGEVKIRVYTWKYPEAETNIEHVKLKK